jgi:hypothetical protein
MSRQDRLEWFSALKRAQAGAVRTAYDLLVEIEMNHDVCRHLQEATMRYIGAGLGKYSDVGSVDSFMSEVDEKIDELAHRTPNGVVLPKREFEDAFNDLHGLFASYVRSLGIDHSLAGGFAPLTVRLVKGTTDPVLDQRPFSSTKTHVDLWSGDPADTVTLFIPILGNIERATVEFFHPPDDFEERLLKMLNSYDEGMDMLGPLSPYELQMKHGFAYFMDAAVPHRTLNLGGGARVTLQVQFRRATTEAERVTIEAACDAGRLAHFLPLQDWYSLGTTKRMQFFDTYTDAKRGIFTARPYNEPIYTLADMTHGV